MSTNFPVLNIHVYKYDQFNLCVLWIAVNTDGKLVARIDQQVDSDTNDNGNLPVTKVRTEVNIPSQGVHQTITKETGQDTVITENGNRRNMLPEINQDINNDVSG